MGRLSWILWERLSKELGLGGTEPRADAQDRGRAEGRPSVKDEGQRGRRAGNGRSQKGKEDEETGAGAWRIWKEGRAGGGRLGTLWGSQALGTPGHLSQGEGDVLSSSKSLSNPGAALPDSSMWKSY